MASGERLGVLSGLFSEAGTTSVQVGLQGLRLLHVVLGLLLKQRKLQGKNVEIRVCQEAITWR